MCTDYFSLFQLQMEIKAHDEDYIKKNCSSAEI